MQDDTGTHLSSATTPSRQQTTDSTDSHGSFDTLSWSTDLGIAQDCFSDWSIAVVCRNHECVYYVHKAILAIGPRHSEYFASLFKTSLCEQESQQNRFVHLSDEEADAMPILLNFIYGNNNIAIDDSNESLLIGLCRLGQYLLVPALFAHVANICRQRLPLESLLRLSSELENVVENIEPFHHATASVIVNCSPSIDIQTARMIHPNLLIRAVQMTPNACFELFSDDCILTSMEHHKSALTKDSFAFLGGGICARHDPYGYPPTTSRGKAAMRLLLLSSLVHEDDGEDRLTRVQEKCIEVVTQPTQSRPFSTRIFGTGDSLLSVRSKRLLSRLPKNVLVAVLSKLIENNQDVCGVLLDVMGN